MVSSMFRVLFLCAFATSASAQSGSEGLDRPGAIITVHGAQEIELAVPQPYTPAGETTASKTIHETALRNLTLTGYFKVQDPRSYLEQNAGVEPGEFQFDDWTKIGTAALAKIRTLPPSHPDCDPGSTNMCADVYVYYAVTGEKLAAKRFRADPSQARMLGQKIAGVVLEAVTGDRGFFTSHIAAVSNRTGNKEVYVLGVDGGGVAAVTRNGSINLSPAWSPDGRSLAWTSYKRGNPDMYIKDLVTGSTRVVSNQPGINAAPAWSPDGNTLALTRSTGGDADIYLINAQTGAEIRRITTGGGIDVAPSFSPDGTMITYSSERSGGSQIYVSEVATGVSTRVTNRAGWFSDPVFSPDGTQLAFVGRDGNFDILVANTDGTGMTRITQGEGDNEDPSWSPDGRYLLFTSTRRGRSEIWLATANGRHEAPVTHSGGWTQPTWTRF